MNTTCQFINVENQMCGCKGKSVYSYGGFCKKHKDNYLIKDRLIVLDRFTMNPKDYNLTQLKDTYTRYISSKKPSKFKKQDYYESIVELYEKNSSSMPKLNSIKKIQSMLRRRLVKKRIYYQGPGFYNRSLCKNDEDFYTYDPKESIESKYFFSYQDTSGNVWCFDVRSLQKLIEMNYGNPYTMEPLSQEIKDKVVEFIEYLNQTQVATQIQTNVITNRRAAMKQRFVDLFAQVEYSGYSCSVNWILDLPNSRLKRFYKELEDIWNYRANLTPQVKCSIVPPNGQLFPMPVSDYFMCTSKLELQDIMSKTLIQFCQSNSPEDMKLGFMYMLIALSIVCRPCRLTHPWVHFVF